MAFAHGNTWQIVLGAGVGCSAESGALTSHKPKPRAGAPTEFLFAVSVGGSSPGEVGAAQNETVNGQR